MKLDVSSLTASNIWRHAKNGFIFVGGMAFIFILVAWPLHRWLTES